MNHVNAIANRLSLRPPQRRSLEVLERVTDVTGFRKPVTSEALEKIRAEFPTVTDFEREFPSVCFALATGVGKTRLMGAFISYLHLARGLNNFFVLAPNLTIYNKLITDFTPNTPKYVFKGIAEFATNPPALITGDNYEMAADTLFDVLLRCKINIFNISKINSEMRGGKAPRIKRLSEYIGQSYFDYLAGLQDLVILMDESHRYRASAGVRAINELKPVLGLELTATPFVETSKGAVAFKNVIVDYPLGRAMADGFVKEPAVVTRKNFSPAGLSPAQLEQMKLEDGVRLHENVKVELETYARENAQPIVKPFLLVIARDTTHAGQLLKWIQSDEFFQGRYKDKVIQVDSSKTGAEEDEMVGRLLKVEQNDEPTEIVIHVNMLKEGWDVTNLYTIVPLRAANARILIEQSIGRGLRLPYGKRTGVTVVDRLNIIAHDKFQEIIDEANRADSAIHLQQVILPADGIQEKSVTVVSTPVLETLLGVSNVTGFQKPVTFETPQEAEVAKIAYDVIRQYENQPEQIPSIHYLEKPEIQEMITREVQAQYHPLQMTMEGVAPPVNIAAIVAQTTALVQQKTIDIPRIVVVPKTQVRSGFHPFTLQLDALQLAPPSDELVIQTLRTQEREIVGVGKGGVQEKRLEDYVVRGLVDFDDIAYDAHADLLYDLAAQTIQHFRSYLDEEDTRKVLIVYQKQIADFIHAQMQTHYWEDAVEYEAKITKGFDSLKTSAFTQTDAALDFRQAPADKSNMAKYLFMGFTRCLYPYQKFQSDAERRLAVILDHESEKWFKPAKGQFQLFYKWGSDHLEYQPDFVAETANAIYMLESKAANEMTDAQVLAKRDAAVQWCKHASAHAASHNGKPWQYALIPHDVIAGNMTLDWLVNQYGVKSAT
ncbi:MAG: type III restriction endonuclease subunit R [Chloroflexi bacterium UTCFX4]|nr:MAG: type III restriction endonuclease subunit R [Chloroflexi bacterium UTCFX4]